MDQIFIEFSTLETQEAPPPPPPWGLYHQFIFMVKNIISNKIIKKPIEDATSEKKNIFKILCFKFFLE